jgi:hypothetical protein
VNDHREASSENPPAMKIGRRKLAAATSSPAKMPPITGPNAKPRLKAAPKRPIVLARRSGGETSAIKPCATPRVPEKKPLRIRMNIAHHKLGAKAKAK